MILSFLFLVLVCEYKSPIRRSLFILLVISLGLREHVNDLPSEAPWGSSTIVSKENVNNTTTRICSEASELSTQYVERVSGLENFSYDQLKLATQDFNGESVLGVGKFGVYFGGTLADGREVVILEHKARNSTSLDMKRFRNNLWELNKVHQRNILPFWGYNLEADYRRLVYPRIHSSLETIFQSPGDLKHLDWKARYKIAVGVGEGLAYLHEGMHEPHIHGSLNFANILVSREQKEPYIADYGLTSLLLGVEGCSLRPHQQATVANASPYCRDHDIYSYGALLFSLVVGEILVTEELHRKPTVSRAMVDERVFGQCNETQVQCFLDAIAICFSETPPMLSLVLTVLKGGNLMPKGTSVPAKIRFTKSNCIILTATFLAGGVAAYLGFKLSGFQTQAVDGAGETTKELVQGTLVNEEPQYIDVCKHYDYRTLERAANNFRDPPIGQGSFGRVYKAYIPGKGEAAIKKLIVGGDAAQNQQFLKEIMLISSVRHKNILPVWGYSLPQKGSPVLMVTPLHSSLHKWLFEPERGQWLNWKARLKIAIDVAEGLTYLHDGLQQRLMHCDIKPGNILFNPKTCEAYIADFGTAKLMQRDVTEVNTETRGGTRGYMCPIYRDKKIRSPKSDVYSFGVLLFVLAAGNQHNKGEICDLVEASRNSFVIESRFRTGDDTFHEAEVYGTLRVARACINKEPSMRPDMKTVVMVLNCNS